MAIKELKDGDIVLARHITAAEWDKKGLNFYSPNDDFIQVGTWHYEAGKELLAHTHNKIDRTIDLTQEVVYVKKGRMKARIYNLKNEFVAEWIGEEGDIMVMMRGGHGYDILEDGTQILEVKNGPYVGLADRVRL